MTQVKTNNAPQQQYRILRSNETVQQGDEFRGDSSWFDCHSTIGKTVQQNVDAEPQSFGIGSFRRPLPCMPGYRYLQADEAIQTGDEFWSIDQNVWTPTISQGFTPEDQDLTYRRKIEQVQPPTDTKPSTDVDGFVRVKTKGGSFMTRLGSGFFGQRVKICPTPDNEGYRWETEDADAHSDIYFDTIDECLRAIRKLGFTGTVEIVDK
jgi:hypothetical protein